MLSSISESIPHNTKSISLAVIGSFTIASCNYAFYETNKMAVRLFKEMTFTPEKAMFTVGYVAGIVIFSQIFSFGLKMLMKSWETPSGYAFNAQTVPSSNYV